MIQYGGPSSYKKTISGVRVRAGRGNTLIKKWRLFKKKTKRRNFDVLNCDSRHFVIKVFLKKAKTIRPLKLSLI